MKYLLILPLLLVSSCSIIPTVADIRAVADDLEQYQLGQVSYEDTVASLDARVSEIGERKTPMSIQELLMAAAGTAIMGGAGANHYRNRKRLANDEKI